MASSKSMGVSMNEIYLNRGPWGFAIAPIKPSKYHKILYELPVDSVSVPKPHYGRKSGFNEEEHVRLPYIERKRSGSAEPSELQAKKHWEHVQEALLQPIEDSRQLEAVIKTYLGTGPKFYGLHHLFENNFTEEESEHFFTEILPGIVRLALSLPNILPANLPFLKSGSSKSVSLSQHQIGSLMANAFLCTFNQMYPKYPTINFDRLFSSFDRTNDSIVDKIKCIIHYFKRILTKMPVGVVTFERKHLYRKQLPRWDMTEEILGKTKLHISSSGTIEDDGLGLLQVDFANKYIGGGVLGHGCVQEEIRFVICPELIISRLFTEEIKDNEAVLIIGAEQFSKYSGYANTFTWAGDFKDRTPFDINGRKHTSIVAIDAIPFHHTRDQFKSGAIRRELGKAFIGFHSIHDTILPLAAVATGNWGCGAFRGDPNLKWLIQLMAATVAKRDLVYYTFNDEELMEQIYDTYRFIVRENITVKQLWRYFCRFDAADLAPSKFIAYIQQAHMDLKTQPSVKQFFNLSKNRSANVETEFDRLTASTSSNIEDKSKLSPVRKTREIQNDSPEKMDIDSTEYGINSEDFASDFQPSPPDIEKASKRKHCTNSTTSTKQIEETKKPESNSDVLDIINILNGDQNENTRKSESTSSNSLFQVIDALSKKQKNNLPTSPEFGNANSKIDIVDVDAKISIQTQSSKCNLSGSKTKITDYFTKTDKSIKK